MAFYGLLYIFKILFFILSAVTVPCLLLLVKVKKNCSNKNVFETIILPSFG